MRFVSANESCCSSFNPPINSMAVLSRYAAREKLLIPVLFIDQKHRVGTIWTEIPILELYCGIDLHELSKNFDQKHCRVQFGQKYPFLNCIVVNEVSFALEVVEEFCPKTLRGTIWTEISILKLYWEIALHALKVVEEF
ncbi:hypothetical protein CEXT_240261 [Caerostris extrusa]|uniref:Uncharacterized protein n=1 Tax=Caerostris extrusa TaxID=172846 RepID=A0AAV4PTA4_CAEEX|nr:hypothetical protein CEXT_240261 [Caerostris extrusa]